MKLSEYLDSSKFGRPRGAASVMTEDEIRELCEAFFDAYQDRRVDVLDRVTPTTASSGTTSSAARPPSDENLARYHDSYAGQRRRTYDDRIVNTFDDGFVIQYTLNGVMHTATRGALWICIVGQCRDGQITRIDEYMDSSKFAAWVGWEERGSEEGLADPRAVRPLLRRDRAEGLRRRSRPATRPRP